MCNTLYVVNINTLYTHLSTFVFWCVSLLKFNHFFLKFGLKTLKFSITRMPSSNAFKVLWAKFASEQRTITE